MTRMDQLGHTEQHGGYVVRRPRATDAIGLTLSIAFVNETDLPSDMQRALDAIDRRERN
jgi:hypothetical protein